MIEIKLPWPPSKLSPNMRQHWAVTANAKKKYRRECEIITRAQIGPIRIVFPNRIKLSLTFYRPTLRSYDRDNLLARMKSGIDGMCDALKIDDEIFDPVVVSVAEEKGNFVLVQIGE